MNKKVAAVVSSSKMISKVREKQKIEKQLNMPQSSVDNQQPSGSRGLKEATKGNVEALPGMIGSLEEYASLVGTTVGKLQDSRYVPPEVSESEDEESDEEGVPGEGDL